LDIRTALPSEATRALEITLAAYAEYEAVLRPEYWEIYREHIVETVSNFGAAEQVVALTQGQIVGTMLLYPPGMAFAEEEVGVISLDCPEVRLVAVAPEGRGLGVGRALMVSSIDRARTAGSPGLVLHTMAMMKAARSLYDSLGFCRAPELDFQPAEDWYAEGFQIKF
jgi:GNAT superfamily N-acetyltransferase